MKKGLVITGLAFIIAVIVIASANYLVISNQNKNKANVVKMKIDAVTNRNQDIKWIINNTVEEGINQGSNCTETTQIIKNNLQQAMADNLTNIGPVKTQTYSLGTDNSTCPYNFTVNLEYNVKTNNENISIERTFSENYNY